MDGLDAIQIVNFHIINTHTLFPVAFKKMQLWGTERNVY